MPHFGWGVEVNSFKPGCWFIVFAAIRLPTCIIVSIWKGWKKDNKQQINFNWISIQCPGPSANACNVLSSALLLLLNLEIFNHKVSITSSYIQELCLPGWLSSQFGKWQQIKHYTGPDTVIADIGSTTESGKKLFVKDFILKVTIQFLSIAHIRSDFYMCQLCHKYCNSSTTWRIHECCDSSLINIMIMIHNLDWT